MIKRKCAVVYAPGNIRKGLDFFEKKSENIIRKNNRKYEMSNGDTFDLLECDNTLRGREYDLIFVDNEIKICNFQEFLENRFKEIRFF